MTSDHLEEFQKRQGHGNPIHEWFYPEDGQVSLVLEIILNEEPSDGGRLKSQIICVMRYINMTRGMWIPKNRDVCAQHDTPETVIDDVINCDNCFDGHLTKENCEIFHSVGYPDKPRNEWRGRTLRNNLTEGAKLCRDLGLITLIDARNFDTARLTEKGSRIHQLLELREYLSLNGRDMPTRILNPYLGAMQYADEVGIVTRM